MRQVNLAPLAFSLKRKIIAKKKRKNGAVSRQPPPKRRNRRQMTFRNFPVDEPELNDVDSALLILVEYFSWSGMNETVRCVI
jgi:hypothetical protein